MSMYPPFERVTASRLQPDDEIIVRKGKRDHWTKVGPGRYRVLSVTEQRTGVTQRRECLINTLHLQFNTGAAIIVDPSVKLNRVLK